MIETTGNALLYYITNRNDYSNAHCLSTYVLNAEVYLSRVSFSCFYVIFKFSSSQLQLGRNVKRLSLHLTQISSLTTNVHSHNSCMKFPP